MCVFCVLVGVLEHRKAALDFDRLGTRAKLSLSLTSPSLVPCPKKVAWWGVIRPHAAFGRGRAGGTAPRDSTVGFTNPRQRMRTGEGGGGKHGISSRTSSGCSTPAFTAGPGKGGEIARSAYLWVCDGVLVYGNEAFFWCTLRRADVSRDT